MIVWTFPLKMYAVCVAFRLFLSVTPSLDPLGRVYFIVYYMFTTLTLLLLTHTLFFAFDISVFVFYATAGRWWKHETNIVTLVALCAPTVTSTSNRRAISLWRESCTVRLTLALEWDHRRDTTSSQLSLLHRFTINTQIHIQTDTHVSYICLMCLSVLV